MDKEKRDRIMGLIAEITMIQGQKNKIITEQRYEDAAALRDTEKAVMVELDKVSGVNGFYGKVYDTEKILQHLEKLVFHTEELKKLRPKRHQMGGEVLQDIDFDKKLLYLYRQRDEAYEAVLQLREIIEVDENKS